MNSLLRQWIATLPQPEAARATALLGQKSLALPGIIKAVGDRQHHVGPHSEFASVSLTVEPSSAFELEDRVPCRDELLLLHFGWPECVGFGVLDTLVFWESGPLYAIRLCLVDAAYHAVDSSESAFRSAGREAGKAILRSLQRGLEHGSALDMT